MSEFTTARTLTAPQSAGEALTLNDLVESGLPLDLPIAFTAGYGLQRFATKAVVDDATNQLPNKPTQSIVLT